MSQISGKNKNKNNSQQQITKNKNNYHLYLIDISENYSRMAPLLQMEAWALDRQEMAT